MSDLFKPINNKNNYEYIVEQIQTMIVEEKLKVGDVLPPERQLSEAFGTSRASVREALKVLTAIGITESRQGEGTYIVNKLAPSATNALMLMFYLNKGTLNDILYLRRAIEIESGKIIIERNREEDFIILKDIMDQYFKENDFERRRELDKQFHTAIIKLSGNLFFIYLLDALHSLIIPFIDDMIDLTLITSSEQIIFNDHKDILNALLNKDKVAFARAIDMHIYVDETHSETLKAKFAHWSLQ